jgi:hypothetical protein
MGNRLENITKAGVLASGLCFKGAAFYVAYVQGGEHFMQGEYSEAAKHCFLIAAPLGLTANILLGTSCALYFKEIKQKLMSLNGKNKEKPFYQKS